MTITDRTLRRIVRQLQELPGQACCSSTSTATATRIHITSSDVNDYIREATGGDFTAKHFRTWGATVIGVRTDARQGRERADQRQTMVEPVAEALGNTPAMSRKAYVHPALIEAVKERPRDPLDGLDGRARANGCRRAKSR